MDFDEIFCRGRAWLKDQVIQFWWRSGSRFGSGSPKSEIRILRIAVFGGGLCSLSVFSFDLGPSCLLIFIKSSFIRNNGAEKATADDDGSDNA